MYYISYYVINYLSTMSQFLDSESQKYIQQFKSQLFVIKYGGAALESEHTMPHFLSNIAQIHKEGIRIILIHGGGKHLSYKMKERNMPVNFKNGLRVTSRETAILADEAFSELNDIICKELHKYDVKTKSYKHGQHFKSPLLDIDDKENRVGSHLSHINMEDPNLTTISVVSSIVQEEDDNTLLNINADQVAVDLAVHFKAQKVIFISDVNGIYTDINKPETKLDHVTEKDIHLLIEKGILHGGMQLKVEMALKALKGGVNKAHFIDGSIENSLLKEIFTDKGIGTEIVHE